MTCRGLYCEPEATAQLAVQTPQARHASMSSPPGSEINSLMKLADGVCLVLTILVHLLSQVQFLSGEVLDTDDSWIVTLFVRSLRCLLSDIAYFLRFNALVNIPKLCKITLYVSVSQIEHWREESIIVSDNDSQ